MYEKKKIGALLLMAGDGKRFLDKTPKQFQYLFGKRVYSFALDTMDKLQIFDEIILVSHPDWVLTVQQEVPKHIRVISGGKTRQDSSFLGLKALSASTDFVLIHDGARPFVSEKILLDNLQSVQKYGAVDTCIPSTDTLLKSTGSSIEVFLDRRVIYRGQTPQTFNTQLIKEAHEKNPHQNATDDCQLVHLLGHSVHIVRGSEENFKITSQSDLLLAHGFLKSQL